MPIRNLPVIDESNDPYHRMPRRRRRRQSNWRFGMRTLLLLMTACCLFFTGIHFWGAQFVPNTANQVAQIRNHFPTTPASDAAPLFFFVASLILGLPLIWIVYHLNDRKSFFAFACLAGFGMIALFGALSLEVRPLRETELKDMSFMQIQRIILLLFGCVLPVSSFCGWVGRNWASDD